MELRKAIFDIVEYLTQKALSDQARKLILHYFNQSREDGAYAQALSAISRYYGDTIPMGENMPLKLRKMFDILQHEAHVWDEEE